MLEQQFARLQAHSRLRDERHEDCDAERAIGQRRVLRPLTMSRSTLRACRTYFESSCASAAPLCPPLKADIGEARVALLVEKDVGRLDVAV